MQLTKKAKGRWRIKLALILFGFLLGALIAEVALRIIGFSFPEFYQPDQTRGYALRPGMEGWYRKEGEAYVRINSAGLRDREHQKAKAANTFRIAVLGDSYPEALQVPLEEAFWVVMERKLNECGAFPNQKVEVINFGVSGYGTAQELITLREHVWDYSPDIVLLAVTTSNDITDNSRQLKKTDRVPYFVHREGKLVLDDSFKSTRSFRLQQSPLATLGRWLRNHLRLIQAVEQGHRALRISLASWRSRPEQSPSVAQEANREQADLVSRSQELGVDNLVYLESQDPVWQEAWSVSEDLILLMRDEVARQGAKLIVVTLSNGPQVFPDVNVRKKFMQQFLVQDLFYPDRRIQAHCQANGIDSLMLAPELQTYADQNQAFLHGFSKNPGTGHWNNRGHLAAGELLAQKLCSKGLLK